MALLVGQLLFAERLDDEKVRLDVIVLDRVETPQSPDVGSPLAFDFVLPGDAVWRETLSRLLERWATALLVVELDIVERKGHTLVRVSTRDASLMLEEPAL